MNAIDDQTGSCDQVVHCWYIQSFVWRHSRSGADLTSIAEAAHAKGALLIVVVTEIVALGLLPPPGEIGADIVVAEGADRSATRLGFGGPYVGLFATREKFLRQMPGRICGETVDADGKRGFVLTLSTREQHIRREKATSNICTNSGLCALAFTIHLSLLGEDGIRKSWRAQPRIRLPDGRSVWRKFPASKSSAESFFNEFTVRLPKAPPPGSSMRWRQSMCWRACRYPDYIPAPEMENLLLVACTETVTDGTGRAFAARSWADGNFHLLT